MSSKVLWVALLLGCSGPVPAQDGTGTLSPAARSLYTARLADNAAGNYVGLAASPLIGVPSVPVLDAVVMWDRLRRDAYLGPFADYSAFLTRYPDWPQAAVIRRQAEKAITDLTPMPERLAYFRAVPPQTATGKFRMAEALLATGQAPAARDMARDAWRAGGLDPDLESRLLALFGSSLSAADHAARADRLLWGNQITAAGRLLPLLDPDRRLWLLARLALQAGSSDASNRLAVVPDALRNDPGLLRDRARWLNRSDADSARALLAGTAVRPGSATDPEAWLRARLEYARAAWRAGDPGTAYRIAAGHASYAPGTNLLSRGLSERQQIIDTEWLAGWLALRKLGRAADAVRHFQTVRAAALTPLSQTRGDYWIGRALEAAGRQAEARRAFEAAAAHPDYFYGQLAAERIGRPLALPRLAAPTPMPQQLAAFRAEPRVQAIFALGDLGDRARQTLFLRQLGDTADTLPRAALVAGLAGPLARQDAGVYAGKAARSDGELALIDASFPTLALPDSLTPGWTMIHAIARQESQFDRAARSSANALGLMQLLPATAAETATKIGLAPSTAQLTEDPIYNVTLGSAYFGRLMTSFGGFHPLAVAAYNAGPGNARKFITANGDPRQPGVDVIDWIESIPLSETRNYVQRVLENAVVYDMLHPQTARMPTTNRLSAYLGKSSPG